MPTDQGVPAAGSMQTRESLRGDLQQLGLAANDSAIVHASLSSLGWVCGGAVALIQALMDTVTEGGTLVMAAHSGELSDPALWHNPPVPQEWWPAIRQHMPLFNPRITPTRGVGRVAELFRTWPGALRSGHPALSFSAWGRHARRITREQPLEFSLGERSPLGHLYELDAKVLLLGVDHGANTSLHLAEHRARGAREMKQGAPVLEGGQRVWRSYREIELHEELFPKLGSDYEAENGIEPGRVGLAEARLFSLRSCVDFAVPWIEEHRRTAGGIALPHPDRPRMCRCACLGMTPPNSAVASSQI